MYNVMGCPRVVLEMKKGRRALVFSTKEPDKVVDIIKKSNSDSAGRLDGVIMDSGAGKKTAGKIVTVGVGLLMIAVLILMGKIFMRGFFAGAAVALIGYRRRVDLDEPVGARGRRVIFSYRCGCYMAKDDMQKMMAEAQEPEIYREVVVFTLGRVIIVLFMVLTVFFLAMFISQITEGAGGR